MSVYAVAAIIAVMIKIIVGIVSQKFSWADQRWNVLVVVFLIQNLLELLTYRQFSIGIEPLHLLKAYYVTLLFLLVSVLGFVVDRKSVKQESVLLFFSIVSVLMLIGVFFSDQFILGSEPSTFPIKAVKGDLFQVYLIVGLSCAAASIVVICTNLVMSKTQNDRQTQAYHMAAYSPFIAITLFVLLGELFKYEANGSELCHLPFISIASALFMLITVVLHSTPAYLIERVLPCTNANRLYKNTGLSALKGVHESNNLKQVLEQQEALLLIYAIKKRGRNKSQVAKFLGIGRRTLDRKLKKHELWWRGESA